MLASSYLIATNYRQPLALIMKSFLLLLISLLFLPPLLSQVSVTFKIKSCKHKNIDLRHYRAQLRKDSSTYAMNIRSGEKTIELVQGKYTLFITNLYNQKLLMNFSTDSLIQHEVNICVDSLILNKPTISFIDSLRFNESYSITMYSKGDYHRKFDSLTVSRTKKNYILTYKKGKIVLSKHEIELIREFEKELQYAQKGVCTTTQYYHIYYNETVQKFIDGNCQWKGLKLLKNELLLKDYDNTSTR